MSEKKDLPKWYELPPGLWAEPGSAVQYNTGSWRSKKPITDEKKCIKCGVCWLFCPDNARYQTSKGHYETDYTYCKGCGICSSECPTGCIVMIEEGE